MIGSQSSKFWGAYWKLDYFRERFYEGHWELERYFNIHFPERHYNAEFYLQGFAPCYPSRQLSIFVFI